MVCKFSVQKIAKDQRHLTSKPQANGVYFAYTCLLPVVRPNLLSAPWAAERTAAVRWYSIESRMAISWHVM